MTLLQISFVVLVMIQLLTAVGLFTGRIRVCFRKTDHGVICHGCPLATENERKLKELYPHLKREPLL